jgi:hypothetical protein
LKTCASVSVEPGLIVGLVSVKPADCAPHDAETSRAANVDLCIASSSCRTGADMMHQRPPSPRARQSPADEPLPPRRRSMTRRPPLLVPAAGLAVLSLLAACTSMRGGGSSSAATPTVDSAVVVLPTSGAAEQMRSGCWASFYSERGFNGDSLTLIGPVELQTLDKGSAQQLRRDLRSVVTGPRATLTLYEKQFLSARWVGFTPDSREPSLTEQLGFGGRIESMKLSC